FNNTDCVPLQVAQTDLVVQDIQVPGSPVRSGTSTTVYVTVKNIGPGYAYGIPITAQISGGPVSQPPVSRDFGPFQTVIVPVSVVVGPSPFNCGQADSVLATAWAPFPLDPSPNDNMKTVTTLAIESYWDLQVTAIRLPDIPGPPYFVKRSC